MCYKLIMSVSKIFDESKDSIGIKKIFNIGEQKKIYPQIKKLKKDMEDEYEKFRATIDNIRFVRDKIYAHTDKKYLTEILDSHIKASLKKLGEMLEWAWNTIYQLMKCTGAVIVNRIPTNKDLYKIINLIICQKV